MLSVLDILILVLCFESTTGSPLKRYTNATAPSIAAPTKPHTIEALHVASAPPTESPPQIVTGPTTLIVQPSTSLSEDCESMPVYPTEQAKNGQEGKVTATTPTLESPRAQHAVATRPGSPSGTYPRQTNDTATAAPRVPNYGGETEGSPSRTSGTTTLTLYTTVPPIVQPSGSTPVPDLSADMSSYGDSTAPISGSGLPSASTAPASSALESNNAASSSANAYGSGSVPPAPTTPESSAFPSSSSAIAYSNAASSSASGYGSGAIPSPSTAPGNSSQPSSSSAVASGSTISESASGYGSSSQAPKDRGPKSSAPVWGSLTLTYDVSSNAATRPIPSTPGTTFTDRPNGPQSTGGIETEVSSSSGFAYPFPTDTAQESTAQPSSNTQPTQPSQLPDEAPTYPSAPPQASSESIASPPSYNTQPTQAGSQPPDYAPTNPPSPPEASQSTISTQPAPTPSSAPPEISIPAPPQYHPSPPSTAAAPPPVASEAAPTAPDAVEPSTTATAALGGITIVPINPDATTVYITVTTTDPGWTTTVMPGATGDGGWW